MTIRSFEKRAIYGNMMMMEKVAWWVVVVRIRFTYYTHYYISNFLQGFWQTNYTLPAFHNMAKCVGTIYTYMRMGIFETGMNLVWASKHMIVGRLGM